MTTTTKPLSSREPEAPATHRTARVRLTRVGGYEFQAQTDHPSRHKFTLDEAPPVGTGRGPDASHLLAAAVGQDLASSFVRCAEEEGLALEEVTADVSATLRPEEDGRWRVARIVAKLRVDGIDEGELPAFTRCRDAFEDLCALTPGLGQAFPVEVAVRAYPHPGSEPAEEEPGRPRYHSIEELPTGEREAHALEREDSVPTGEWERRAKERGRPEPDA